MHMACNSQPRYGDGYTRRCPDPVKITEFLKQTLDYTSELTATCKICKPCYLFHQQVLQQIKSSNIAQQQLTHWSRCKCIKHNIQCGPSCQCARIQRNAYHNNHTQNKSYRKKLRRALIEISSDEEERLADLNKDIDNIMEEVFGVPL